MTVAQTIRPTGFAEGVELGAYAKSGFPGEAAPKGPPSPDPVDTATVDENGDVAFTGLTANESYWAAPIPVDEVQTLTVDATAGDYRLRYGSDTTGDLAFDADDATDVQAALEALPSVGSGNVTVVGGPGDDGGGTPYVITFAAALSAQDVAPLEVVDGSTGLTGGGAVATLETTTEGRAGGEVYIAFEARA